MRDTPSQVSTRPLDPASVHSLGYVLVSLGLLIVATAAAVLAASYPAAATGVALLAAAGWYAVRTFRRFYRTRKRAGWTRTVCVPKTGVCVTL